VILKRELPERFGDVEGALPGFLEFDYTQEAFKNSYLSIDGKKIFTHEVLRYQGGYLYRIIRKIWDDKGSPLNGASVRLRRGPNRFVPVGLAPGIRQRFTDQTYVVLSVLNGLPLGVDQGVLRSGSERDVKQIVSLLDNPTRIPATQRIGEYIDALSSSVKALLEQRRIAESAARRVGRDPDFRTAVDYPIFWIQQIDPLENYSDRSSLGFRNAVAKNAGILSTLSDLIVNLPLLEPDNKAKMGALHNLNKDSFQPVKGKRGLFILTDKAMANF